MARARLLLALIPALVIAIVGCKATTTTTTMTPTGTTVPPAAPSVESPRIALIMKSGGNPFFDAMQAGAQLTADKLGVDLLPRTITDESSDEQQINIVETMIVDKVDAILIAPANSKSLVAPLLAAQEAGIPVINIDNRLDADTMKSAGLQLVAYVGADNEEGGYLAGKHLCELLGGNGEVAMLEGRRGVDNAEARKAGFERACAECPGITIVTSESANWDTQEAQNKFGPILAAYPDIKGLFCANDNMALGAIAAIAEMGRDDIKVVSYDNIAAAQEAIKAGKLAATIEQHPNLMGAEGVKAAVAYLKGEPVEAETLVPLDVVTAETLSAGN